MLHIDILCPSGISFREEDFSLDAALYEFYAPHNHFSFLISHF